MIKEYGYEYNAVLNTELWKHTKGKNTVEKLWGALCLRSGRDALKAIAREYPNATVLLPALSCESMIHPFETYGCNVLFYKLNKLLQADLSSISDILNAQEGIKILLFCDYFGIEMINDRYLYSIKKNYADNLVIVRDITHNFLYYSNDKFKADFTIVSLRKWVNIPDGGLLWGKHELKVNCFGNDLNFSEVRLKAQCLRNDFFNTGNISYKEKYRKMFSKVTEIIDNDIEPSRMSEYAYQMTLNTNWNAIKNSRQSNIDYLIDILKKNEKITLIQTDSEKSNLYLPILIDKRNETQMKLAKLGIYNTIIWPLREEQRNCCAISRYIENHMLAVPCDQRYNIKEMKYIVEEIERIINE